MRHKTIKILLFGLMIFILGWFSNEIFENFLFEKRIAQNKILADSIASQVNQVNRSLITELKNGKKFDPYFKWKTNHADTTNYMCEIEINDDYLIHWFHGQCVYYYFTYQTSDSTITMLWSHKSDCKLNMEFLEKSNDIKDFPKYGDTFATYTLINDSTLKAKYYFPEWTKKINELAKDSLFATFYYIKE